MACRRGFTPAVLSSRLGLRSPPDATRVTSLVPGLDIRRGADQFPSSVCVRLYPRVRTFKGQSDSSRATSGSEFLPGLNHPLIRRPVQPCRRVVEPLFQVADALQGQPQGRPGRELFEPLPCQFEPVLDRLLKLSRAVPARCTSVRARSGVERHDRRRRRLGAVVGDEVGDRHVDLVTHGRHDRHHRLEDRRRDDLLVERPQVLGAAAAAADHDRVERQDAAARGGGSGHRIAAATSAAAPSPCTRLGRTISSVRASAGRTVRSCRGSAAPVALATTPTRCGKPRQRPLAPRVEVALREQLLLQLPQREFGRADPLRLKLLDDEL